MGEHAAERVGEQRPQRHFAIDVGVDEEKWRAAKKRQRGRDAACGLERLRLARIAHGEPETLAVGDVVDDLLREVRDVDYRLAATGRRQALEVPAHERLAADADQRLWRVLGERPQPLAAPGGKQHRFHAATSSSKRASGASSR